MSYDPDAETAAVKAANDEYQLAYDDIHARFAAEVEKLRDPFDAELQAAMATRDAAVKLAHKPFYDAQAEQLEAEGLVEQAKAVRDMFVDESAATVDA